MIGVMNKFKPISVWSGIVKRNEQDPGDSGGWKTMCTKKVIGEFGGAGAKSPRPYR